MDALTQKTFVKDFLTKKVVKNTGQLKQCYIRGSHPAIIDPDMFDAVQVEMEKRASTKAVPSRKSPFAHKVVCGECGTFYGHKTWNDKKKKRYDVWCCNSKYEAKQKCNVPNMRQEILEKGFVMAFNKILSQKNEIVKTYEKRMAHFADKDIRTETQIRENYYDEALQECAKTAGNFIPYTGKDDEYRQALSRSEEFREQLKATTSKAMNAISENARLKQFTDALKSAPAQLITFDDNLCRNVLEKVIVAENELVYHFYDGNKVRQKLNGIV